MIKKLRFSKLLVRNPALRCLYKAGVRDQGSGVSKEKGKRGNQEPAQPLAAVGASLIEHETWPFCKMKFHTRSRKAGIRSRGPGKELSKL